MLEQCNFITTVVTKRFFLIHDVFHCIVFTRDLLSIPILGTFQPVYIRYTNFLPFLTHMSVAL